MSNKLAALALVAALIIPASQASAAPRLALEGSFFSRVVEQLIELVGWIQPNPDKDDARAGQNGDG